MEIEFWWLAILPTLFVLGWAAARYDSRQWHRETRDLPRSYFRGVNFLLNEQPDRAIDAFVEVAQIDPETIELHYALGALFRRRGETDRAIRVHQALLGRKDLTPHEREHALHELALDYYKAGLLDRAEQTLERISEPGFRAQADRLLLDIHEMARDWQRASEVAGRLAKDTGQSMALELSHYHCELAEAALARGDHDAVQAELAAALKADGRSVRAKVLEGHRQIARDDLGRAAAAWSDLEQWSPQFLALVAAPLADALLKSSQAELGCSLFERQYQLAPSVDVLKAWARCVRVARGDDAALDLLREGVRKRPSLLALEDLLNIELDAAEGARKEELALTLKMLGPQARRMARYVCTACGFKARTYYWRCPGCNRWQSYGPRRHEELENPQ